MAQSGFTPIQLYRTATASATPTAGNLADGELAINTNDGKLFYKDSGGTVQLLASKAGASGDVVGPASSTDNAVVRFDGTTGKLVQNSVVTIADSTGDVAGVGALTASGAVTLSGGTANGVAYLNGSKVLTTGSALTFDGTNLATNGSFSTGDAQNISLNASSSGQTNRLQWKYGGTAYAWIERVNSTGDMAFGVQSSEAMRLTSTGLGIGTSSPGYPLQVRRAGGAGSLGITVDSVGSINRVTQYYSIGDTTAVTTGHAWYTRNASATDNLSLLLDNSGNLGIGTSSPAYKLDVAGNGYVIRAAATTGTSRVAGFMSNTSGQISWGLESSAGGALFTGAGAYDGCIGTDVAKNFNIGTNGTVRATFDTSGNLGLGVTPSAWDLGKAIEVGTVGNSIWGVGSSNMVIGSNIYYASSSYKYANTAAASAYQQAGGVHYWYNAASGTAGNAISFTQAMTLTAGGDLGVGETSPGQRLVVRNTSAAPYVSIIAGDSSVMGILMGKASNTVDGQILYSNSTQAMQFVTASSERARITSGGNLLVGTTSQYASSLLSVAGPIAGRSTGVDGTFAPVFNAVYSGDSAQFGTISHSMSSIATSSGFRFLGGGAGSGTTQEKLLDLTRGQTIFYTGDTERARITSGGDLLVNRTSTLGTAKFVVEADTTTANPMTVSNSRSTAATDYSILFYRNASLVGSVQTSLTATSYVTSSDYRLKENIQPMTGALAKVAALKPVTYKWKATGGEADGFIAHELAEVCPQAVTGEKDAVDADGNPKYQGIDTSFLVATLAAAIQEQQAMIQQLQAEVAALKGT